MVGKRVIFNFQDTKAKVKPLKESRLQITIFGPSRECLQKRHDLSKVKKVSKVKGIKTKYSKFTPPRPSEISEKNWST